MAALQALRGDLEAARAEIARLQRRLRQAEEKYTTLVSSAGDAILIADYETARFVEANQAAADLFGYSRCSNSRGACSIPKTYGLRFARFPTTSSTRVGLGDPTSRWFARAANGSGRK